MTVRLRALALVLVAGLAGCGSNPEMVADIRLFQNLGGQMLARTRPAPPQRVDITRAQLAQIAAPMVLADLERVEAQAVAIATARNGGVTTYVTTDGISLALAGGVLVATRGLAGDLMSVAAPSAAVLARGQGSHARSYFHLGDDDRTERRDVTCTLSPGGTELLTIIERRHSTLIVQESCAGAGLEFTNTWWIEDGRIRQSRQWGGPLMGHVKLADLD